jgi:hypothetical protein
VLRFAFKVRLRQLDLRRHWQCSSGRGANSLLARRCVSAVLSLARIRFKVSRPGVSVPVGTVTVTVTAASDLQCIIMIMPSQLVRAWPASGPAAPTAISSLALCRAAAGPPRQWAAAPALRLLPGKRLSAVAGTSFKSSAPLPAVTLAADSWVEFIWNLAKLRYRSKNTRYRYMDDIEYQTFDIEGQ